MPDPSKPPNPPERRRDELLILAINGGEHGAFESLYRRHRDWVLRVALRFCPDRHAALDVLQETFLYLVRKLPTLKLTGKLTTFLYPAVKNLAIEADRKRRRAASATPPAETPVESLHLSDDARAGLAAAVAALPDPQREVLLMRIVDGMSLAEIALALAVPEGTVKSRLHYALSALRDDPRTGHYYGT